MYGLHFTFCNIYIYFDWSLYNSHLSLRPSNSTREYVSNYLFLLYKDKIYSYFLFSITKNSFVCSSPYNKCVWPLSCLGNLLSDNLAQIAIRNNKNNHFMRKHNIITIIFDIYTSSRPFRAQRWKIFTPCIITFNDQMPFQCHLSSRMFLRFKSWV